MLKKAVTKPVFGKIFIVRFLFWLVLFSFAAGYVYTQLHDIVLQSSIYNPTQGYRRKIEETADMLSEIEPDSNGYEILLSRLKFCLAD